MVLVLFDKYVLLHDYILNYMLVQTHVVKEILDENGNIVKTIDPIVKRKVISEQTAKRVTSMLYENAVHGAAKNAYVPGYT